MAMPIVSGFPYSRYARGGVHGTGRGPASLTIHGADNEVIVEGPGRITFNGNLRLTDLPELGDQLEVSVALAIAGSDHLLRTSLPLTEVRGDQGGRRKWAYSPPTI
jgi:hypothetical protein